MPMFDIESADKLKLRDCTTNAETMVKATGKVGLLDAERCKAGIGVADLPVVKPSLLRKLFNYCLNTTNQIVIGVCTFIIGSLLFIYLTT